MNCVQKSIKEHHSEGAAAHRVEPWLIGLMCRERPIYLLLARSQGSSVLYAATICHISKLRLWSTFRSSLVNVCVKVSQSVSHVCYDCVLIKLCYNKGCLRHQKGISCLCLSSICTVAFLWIIGRKQEIEGTNCACRKLHECLCAHASVLTCWEQSAAFDRTTCKHPGLKEQHTDPHRLVCGLFISTHTHIASTWVGISEHRRSHSNVIQPRWLS